MKRYLLASLLLSAGITTNALNYNYLILKQSDGNEIAIKGNGLRITYDSVNINASSEDGITSLPLSTLHSMYFSQTLPASINKLHSNNAEVNIKSRTITIKLASHANISISDIKGMSIGHFHSCKTNETIILNLQPGTYILKIDEDISKILIP